MLQNKFDIFFFDKILIKMRSGGTSTNFSNVLKQIISDFKIIKKIFFRNYFDIFFVFLYYFSKNLEKLDSFFKIFNYK